MNDLYPQILCSVYSNFTFFLCAIEHKCCLKTTYQCGTLLPWVTCSYITMNVDSIPHTRSCCPAYFLE